MNNHTDLSLEEMAILSAVTRPMTLSEAAAKSTSLLDTPRFDRCVALALIPSLVTRGLLTRYGTRLEPTRSGLEEVHRAAEIVKELNFNLTTNINPKLMR